MKSEILIMVDVQNVYFGSRNFSHGKGKVDYEKLILVLKDELATLHNAFNLTIQGYVVQTPRYRGMDFFAFLRKIGYSLRVKTFDEEDNDLKKQKGSVGSLMQMDLLDACPQYDAVLVVSGSGVFEPAFRAVKNNWPDVICMMAAFEDTLHDVYAKRPDLIDHIIRLDERVLRYGS